METVRLPECVHARSHEQERERERDRDRQREGESSILEDKDFRQESVLHSLLPQAKYRDSDNDTDKMAKGRTSSLVLSYKFFLLYSQTCGIHMVY